MTQELPNESDVYRDKVCFEKNMETRRPRQAQRRSRKTVVNQAPRSLSPSVGQGGIDFSPAGGLFVFFTVSKDI